MNSVEARRLLDEPRDRSPSPEEHQPESSEFLLDASINDRPASERPDEGGLSTPPRSLTYLNGLALVVGLQIGSGIFSAPAVVLSHVSSPVVAVLVWFLAGLLVWTGASSFIELGTRVPQNGGIQEYLRHCYGDIYGFLFAWIWLLVSRPCAMAMVSLVFSEYLFKAIWPDEDVSVWILKITAFVAIISITYLNCMGTHVGTGAANFFLVLKIFGLGSIAIIGLAHTFIGLKHEEGIPQPNATEYGSATASLPIVAVTGTPSLWTSLGNFTDAVLAALFAYGGWEAVSEPYSRARFLLRLFRLVSSLER
jgi:solute carrier family 7 (L-type amino acid transporter), member 6